MSDAPGGDGTDHDARSAEGRGADPARGRKDEDVAERRPTKGSPRAPPSEPTEERGRHTDDDDDEDLHPVVDAVGSASVYLSAGSFALVLVGLAALALGFGVSGRAAVTIGIVGASGSMLAATVVGALSGSINPLD